MIRREKKHTKSSTEDAEKQQKPAQNNEKAQHAIGTQVVWNDRRQRASVEQVSDCRLPNEQQQRLQQQAPASTDRQGNGKRPIIAISVAPPGGGGVKSVVTTLADEATGQSGVTITGGDGCHELACDHVEVDRLTNDNSSTGQQLDDSKIVADVRENFVALIRYNRLQYFYLGVLLYSVINVILILNSITSLDERQSMQGKTRARQRLFTKNYYPDSEDGGGFLDEDENSSDRRSVECQPNANAFDQTFIGWLLIVFLLPATLLLVLIIAFSFFEFQSIDWKSRETNSSNNSSSNINMQPTRTQTISCCVGVLLAFVLLALPISTIHLSGDTGQVSSSPSGNGTRNGCDENYAASSSPHSLRPPICLIVIIVYLFPYLLDELRLFVKVLCVCSILPLLLADSILHSAGGMTHTNDIQPTNPSSASNQSQDNKQQLLTLVFCSAFALSIGLLKRHQLNRFTKQKVFNGATESIEAKVSLEQQRQQQETLLLSVLPAYVAEQVKRNMVKKMMGSSQQQECEQFATGNNNAQMATSSTMLANSNTSPESHQPLKSTGNQTTDVAGGGQCARSYTLPMSSEQHERQQKVGANHTVADPMARNSRLSSSLACEHQTPTRQNQLQNTPPNNPVQQQQQQQQLPANSNLNINFLPTSGQAARRGFNELYIRTYNNVSLLYGDIVGFTQLCTQLSSSQLVGVLNDLFSHFDHLAERNKIMRIKILGDCYYGVSGIPEFAVMGAKSRAKSSCDNHAINCVNMGLDMIQYIKCLNIRHSILASMEQQQLQQQQQQQQQNSSSSTSRLSFINRCPGSGAGDTTTTTAKRHQPSGQLNYGNACNTMPAFELNMRIGVHTGHIHSGVIGLKKWQFDIWSNDVSIAMRCESSGVAGRVQVTEATVQHLHGSFEFEPSPCSGRDQLLAEREIKTYLISDRVVPSDEQQKKRSYSGLANAAAGQFLMTANHHQIPTDQSASPADTKDPEEHARTKAQASKRPKMNKQDEPAGGHSLLNEDKIREATIGTIRETLLAGETANSNSSNAYALALDHNDLDGINLKFAESSLERSFAKRPISIESRSVELFMLFLLLAVAVSCLNLYFDSSDSGDGNVNFKMQLVFAVTISLFLVANLILSLRTELIEQSSELPRTSSIARTSKDHHFGTKWLTWNTSGEQNFIARKLSQASRASARLSPKSFLCRRSSSSFATIKRCSINTRMSLLAILLAYSAVILEQIYMISNRLFCQRDNMVDEQPPAGLDIDAAESSLGEASSSPTGRTVAEHYQLTVVLVLFALDLCVNTISYKIKFKLLLAIVVLQSIVLIFNPIELSSSSYESASLDQFRSIYKMLTCWPGEPMSTSNHSNPTASRVDSQHQNQQQQQQQSLICRSTDALLLVLALWSLAFARQLEYTNRTNFLWRNRLNVDHEELEYISGINKVLLENILPSHVVQHYLSHPSGAPGSTAATALVTATSEPARGNPSCRLSLTKSSSAELMRLSLNQMRNLHDELYHEQHDSVAVMFASIPHFYEFYDESDISKQGLGCIALLNEIICDFDRLLLKNKFSRIEKIKTIGSTYMAAAGLRPCYLSSSRNSAASQISQQINCMVTSSPPATQLSCPTTKLLGTPTSEQPQQQLQSPSLLASPMDERKFVLSQQKLNLICMIQFASSLMSALNGINKQSFQVFKLRVGINTGPVIAGVIGSQRPFYDIWGDCVNIASRMESLGEIGRIQVEEQTAHLLMECLCTETYSIAKRGAINVKGKGGMVTYFVDKKQSTSPCQQSTGTSSQQQS